VKCATIIIFTLSLLGAVTPAQADDMFTLKDVSFSDGSVASGYFDLTALAAPAAYVDSCGCFVGAAYPDTSAITNYDITITGGTAPSFLGLELSPTPLDFSSAAPSVGEGTEAGWNGGLNPVTDTVPTGPGLVGSDGNGFVFLNYPTTLAGFTGSLGLYVNTPDFSLTGATADSDTITLSTNSIWGLDDTTDPSLVSGVLVETYIPGSPVPPGTRRAGS